MIDRIVLPKFKNDDIDFNKIDFSEFDTDEKFENPIKYRIWLSDKMKEQNIGVGVRDKVLRILEEIGILKFPFGDVCMFPDLRGIVGVQPMIRPEQ